MKTAIQQAIEEINKRVEGLNNMDDVNNLWKSSCAAELLKQREFLIALLPTEKEQIEQAYKEGCMYYSSAFPKEHYNVDAELYYTETFKTDK